MEWSGVVGIDKPIEWTSRQVVDRVAKLVRPAKVGHAGTLDPLATGVVVVAIGSATRLISYLQQGRKHYVGSFRLGQRSNTDDIEGEVIEGGDWAGISESQIRQGLQQFQGVIQQVPPQFSAIHVDGKRAYSLARMGEHVELTARPVEVFSIQLTRFQPPDLEMDIVCGSGTYVRSIGRDLGNWLGCGAIMTALRRMSVGGFGLEISLSIEALNHESLKKVIQPPLQAVAEFPRRVVSPQEIVAIRQGKTIAAEDLSALADATEVTLIDESGRLIAMARLIVAKSSLQPCVVLPAESRLN